MLDSFLLKAQPKQEVLQLNPLEWLMVKTIFGYIVSLVILVVIATYFYYTGMQVSMLVFLFLVAICSVSLLFFLLHALITGRRLFAHF